MTLVAPNAGEGRMLGNIVNKTAPENLVLKLYTNNVTPAETDTAGTYTEAAGSGSAPAWGRADAICGSSGCRSLVTGT